MIVHARSVSCHTWQEKRRLIKAGLSQAEATLVSVLEDTLLQVTTELASVEAEIAIEKCALNGKLIVHLSVNGRLDKRFVRVQHRLERVLDAGELSARGIFAIVQMNNLRWLPVKLTKVLPLTREVRKVLTE